MKKVKLLFLSFLLTVFLPFAAMAKDTCRIDLRETGDGTGVVDVSLAIPAGSAAEITSLRFKLFVSVDSGTIKTPTFSFAEKQTDKTAASAQVRELDSTGKYMIDVVISRPEPFIPYLVPDADGNATVKIGSVHVSSTTLDNGKLSGYVVEVGTYDEYVKDENEDGGVQDNQSAAFLEYVEKGGIETLKHPISEGGTVILEKEAGAEPDTNPSEPEETEPSTPGETEPSTPGETEPSTPGETEPSTPGETEPSKPGETEPSTPGETEPSKPGETEPSTPGETEPSTPPETEPTFDTDSKPSLKAELTSATSDQVKLTWEEVPEADGYQIYLFDETSGKYKKIKTINKGEITTYTASFDYNKKLQFRIRAFKRVPGEATLHSLYSKDVTIKTPVSDLAVPKLTVKTTLGTQQISLSWKKVPDAVGYLIYQKDAKTGKYQKIASLKKASEKSYSVTGKFGETYTFRMRAYKLAADKKTKVYSGYTSAVKVTVSKFDKNAQPASVKGTGNTSGKSITFGWKKVAGADAYQVYQYDTAKKKYVRLTTVKGGNKTSCVSKKNLFAYGSSYKFKIRAYALEDDGTKVYGKFSKEFTVQMPTKAVSNLTAASTTAGEVKISWGKVSKADGYVVYRSTSKNGTYKRVAAIKEKDTLTYTDKKLKSGSTYYYKVRASKKGADGKNVLSKVSAAASVKVK